MCTNMKACKCEFLKAAICGDKKQILKKNFFDQVQTGEHYLFLKDAYSLLDANDKSFRTALTSLISTYIQTDSQHEINIAASVRASFIELYDNFCEGECTELRMKEIVSYVCSRVEHLTYQNLVLIEGFDTYLERFYKEPINQGDMSVSAKDNCCRLF